jgi:hypothetical protein
MPNKLEAEDFSGGITDYYLNAPSNKLRSCKNLLINQFSGMGKPFTRFGSELYSTSAPQLPTGNQKANTAFYYKSILHVQSGTKLYWYNATAWTSILGPSPTSNDPFIGATTSTQFSYSHWNYHTLIANSGRTRVMKMIMNNSDQPELFEAGLPLIDKTGVIFTVGGAGANTYLYKLVYSQTYTTSGAVTFLDVGPPTTSITVSAAAAPTVPNPIVITVIPVLANGATSNFRTASIKVQIYRTIAGGTTFYYVGEVTNGTTTYSDSTSDTNLQLNATLYTTGGVVANDRPLKCKVVHVSKENIAYYGNIQDDSGQILSNRCQQSIAGDIDSSPAAFYVDVDDEIVGISSTKSNVVLLCKNSTYRLDGTFDELGRGGISADRISDTSGCLSAQGVVQALDGVFWLGIDGVYFTDGFKVIRLNADYDKTYRSWTTSSGLEDPTRTIKYQGKYDRVKNRIWWTISEGGVEVDTCYVLDLTWGIKDAATFTTVSGTSFFPTAIEFINGNMIRCDKRGYVLIHKDTLYADPLIDTSVTPTSWSKETIIYRLESIAYNFGTSVTRKYVTGINVTCESTTNLSLQIISVNDDSKVEANLSPIRYRGNISWGDEDVYWGDPELVWNVQGLISEKRRMPARSLRCNYKAIRLTNAKVAIINSDQLGTVSINATAKTATLTNASTFDWPSNAVGYVIAFQADGYVREYTVTARTADVLTYTDSSNTSITNTGQGWVLRGYPKGEVLNLLNYSINYEVSGPTLGVYNNADSGEVGT